VLKHLRLADFIGFPQWRLEKAESSDVALIIPEYFLVIALCMSYPYKMEESQYI